MISWLKSTLPYPERQRLGKLTISQELPPDPDALGNFSWSRLKNKLRQFPRCLDGDPDLRIALIRQMVHRHHEHYRGLIRSRKLNLYGGVPADESAAGARFVDRIRWEPLSRTMAQRFHDSFLDADMATALGTYGNLEAVIKRIEDLSPLARPGEKWGPGPDIYTVCQWAGKQP